MTSDRPEYDLAIIGAGINGAGIARDAALRGMKVIVLDKNDMCTGCSWISSRLIHGGLRYLLIRLGMIAYDLLSIRKRLPNHQMLKRDRIREEEPGLRAEGLRAAARYYDAQVAYAERLVLENLLSARDAGAAVHTHCEVTAIRVSNGAVSSLEYVDRIEGMPHEISVATVVNAAGPWVDRVLETAPVSTKRHIGGTKGSHIIVGKFSGAPRDAFYVEAAADGRPFFIIPWNGQYLIGTTDIRYDGDLDNIRASDSEVDYLLDETNRVFPDAGLTREHIHYAYAGVRPLPHQDKGPESAITRRHIIKLNRRVAEGLISIVGGKLTTYRNLAEQTVDRVAKLRHMRLPDCRTHETMLPGATGIDAAAARLTSLEILSDAGVARLIGIYGGRAADIAAVCEADASLAVTIDDDREVLAAEVPFAIRAEFAKSLSDIIFRRMMVGLDADQGRSLYDAVGDLAAQEFGWDSDTKNQQLDELREYSDSLQVS
jgi:glycerol-3-phosphate dehydrogenase